MSKSNRGTVTSNINRCIDEMITAFDEANQDGAHDVVADPVLDYLVKSNRTKLMEKLHERRMVPKVMDEFDCAALLDKSGIKMAVEKDSTMSQTIYEHTTTWCGRKTYACIRH